MRLRYREWTGLQNSCPWTEPALSHLKFDQPVRGFRQNRKFRKFATHHGYFVASVKARANMAVFVNLVRQILALRGGEAQASEKVWSAREQARAGNAVFFRLCQQRFYQMPATALALLRRRYGDGTDLSQMRAIKMKRAAADNHAAVFEDNEIAHVLADLGQSARQKSSVAGVGGNQSVNPLGVRENGF